MEHDWQGQEVEGGVRFTCSKCGYVVSFSSHPGASPRAEGLTFPEGAAGFDPCTVPM